jgi:hypothetical protein
MSTDIVDGGRRGLWTWFCSASSVATSFLVLTLAIHGWIVGESAVISESSGPLGLEIHLLLLAAFALFATWAAAPLWIGLLLFRRFRVSYRTHVIQACVFAAGWLLSFGAGLALEASPAGRLF